MQLITFNTFRSAIDRISDSLAMRIAYLFGEKLALTGDTIFEFRYKEIFERFSLNQRLDFVEAKSKLEYEEDPVDYQLIRQLNKILNKSKNKPAHIIASMKQMEQQLAVLYKIYVTEHTDKHYVQSGFAELAELVDGEIINGFATNSSNLEKSSKSEIKGSSVLSLDFDEANKTKLFLLHEHFFHLPSIKQINQFDVNHLDAGILDNIMIEPLIIIPNIKFLKASELVVLRKKLADVRTIFCAMVDKWITMCFEENDFEERKNLINLALKPAAEKINNLLTDDGHMKHLQILTNKAYPITIGIAEIPFQLLLDYHLQFGIIKAETAEKMKMLQAKDKRYHHKWPVMFYKLLPDDNIKKDNETTNIETMILTTKKTINID